MQHFFKGFSYIELVVSVAILALLATAAVPYLEKTMQREKEVELRQRLRTIRTAIDDYKKAYDDGRITKVVGASGYPPNLAVLVDGVPNQKDTNKAKIRFLRRLPLDPMYVADDLDADEVVSAADTWGKRAYDSEADSPTEGEDVFDIFSLSDKKGLNGLPYRQW